MDEGEQATRTEAIVDGAVTAWTEARTAGEAASTLQHAGIPAAAMLRVSEVPDSLYFRSRAMFQTFEQPQLPAPVKVDNVPVRSNHLAPPPLSAAPMAGEHTIEIIRDLLRFDVEEIERLIAAGVLETAKPKNGIAEEAAR